MTKTQSEEPLWNGRRISLVVFGIALGVCIGSLVMAVPESTLAARVEGLWNPAVRSAMQAGAALARKDRPLAQQRLQQAAALARGQGNEEYVWTLMLDRCERYQAWDLACTYALQLMNQWPTSLNHVRYGGALLGAGHAAESERYFEWVCGSNHVPSAGAAPEDRLAYDLAQRDLARAYEVRHAFDTAEDLAQTDLRRQAGAGSPWELIASLNDTLAWIHYGKGRVLHTPLDLELARVYEETAAERLIGKASPSLAAVINFHLAAILKAQGMQLAATEAYKKAAEASPEAVQWLNAHSQSSS